jgi:hypothetical protein
MNEYLNEKKDFNRRLTSEEDIGVKSIHRIEIN